MAKRFGLRRKSEGRETEDAALRDIARIEARLEAEIPEARKTMDELLARLRMTRIATCRAR